MTKNEAAKAAIQSFLTMDAPSYALLLDAPWGAGKTHFVREVCGASSNRKEIRYVSLNGVSGESAFRHALLKDGFESTLLDRGALFGNILSRKAKLGDLGSLAKDIVQERLIAQLPDTLIFDDIERSTIDPQILMGLINEFVEHQGKKVILVAHSGAHPQKDEFLSRREKIVGRTIRIDADFVSAYPSFVHGMSQGQGKAFFESHPALVEEVFLQAKHQNLRLLRNAIRDCSMILDRVESELFDAKEPMARFVATYLAFSMALARGDISFEDFDRRESHKIAFLKGEDQEDEKFKPLNRLLNNHKGADIFLHSGAVVSKELADLMFVKGYAGDEALNDLLKATNQFEPQEENPLWKRFVRWGEMSWEELKRTKDEVEDYLFEAESDVVDAGPFLHIADSMLRLEEYGALNISRSDLKKRILERIEALRDKGKIPPADRGKRLGWGRRGNHFTFGGYGFDANEEMIEVLNAMTDAQMSAYNENIERDIEELQACAAEDLHKFKEMITYSTSATSYFDVPIFDKLDIERFASSFIDHMKTDGIETVGDVLEKLADRHRNAADWEGEKAWFQELKKELENQALGHSKLGRAQLELMFRFCWKFEPPAELETEQT